MMNRRIYLLAAIVMISIAGYGQSVEISGRISEEIQSVALKVFNDKTLTYDEVESAVAKGGKYKVKLKYQAPNLVMLDFGGKRSVRLSVTNEKSIEVNYENDEVNISGSPESGSMLSFEEENGEMQAKYFGQLKKDADAAMASGDQEALKEIQSRSASAIQDFLVEFRQWIIDKGEGPAGYYALQFSDFTKELGFIETRLAAFKKKIPDSPLTKALARQVYRSKVVSVGKVPPTISVLDREGEEFSLEQYKGKVLLIDFWAAWCRACRIENPQFVKVHEKYNAQGFEVVSISQDETEQAWSKAIVKDGVDIWRHIWDKDETITNLYSVSSLPQNVVLDREGKILAKNVNAEQLEALLAKNL